MRIPRKGSEGTLEGGEGSAPAPRSDAAQGSTRQLCGRMSAHISLRALCCCGSDLHATILTCTLVASAGSAGGVGWSMTPMTDDATANRSRSPAEMEGVLPMELDGAAQPWRAQSAGHAAPLCWKVGAELPPFVSALPRVDRAPPLPRFVGRRIVRNSRECHPSQCHARARATRDACRLRSLPQRAMWWLP